MIDIPSQTNLWKALSVMYLFYLERSARIVTGPSNAISSSNCMVDGLIIELSKEGRLNSTSMETTLWLSASVIRASTACQSSTRTCSLVRWQ